MINMKSYVWVCCLLAAITVAGFVNDANAAGRVPAARVAGHVVARVLFAADGTAQLIGYFAFIDGISGSVFSGTPSEATAFFTLRSSTFSPQPITNGDITVLLVSGETLNVYLNSSPHGDWNNPDSFSGGQIVATLVRTTPELVINVGTMFSTTGSLDLTSSHEFVFNGQAIDFKELVPNGVTLTETATATPVSGPPGFVGAQPLAGTAVAIGSKLSALGSSGR